MEQALECLYRLLEHPDAVATALLRQMTAQVFNVAPQDGDTSVALDVSTLGSTDSRCGPVPASV